MTPREQILANEHRYQITTDSLINQPLYIFKLSKVYSSSNLCDGCVKLRVTEKVMPYRLVQSNKYICMKVDDKFATVSPSKGYTLACWQIWQILSHS